MLLKQHSLVAGSFLESRHTTKTFLDVEITPIWRPVPAAGIAIILDWNSFDQNTFQLSTAYQPLIFHKTFYITISPFFKVVARWEEFQSRLKKKVSHCPLIYLSYHRYVMKIVWLWILTNLNVESFIRFNFRVNHWILKTWRRV